MGEILELYKILEEVVGAEKAKRATEAIESLISAQKGKTLPQRRIFKSLKPKLRKLRWR